MGVCAAPNCLAAERRAEPFCGIRPACRLRAAQARTGCEKSLFHTRMQAGNAVTQCEINSLWSKEAGQASRSIEDFCEIRERPPLRRDECRSRPTRPTRFRARPAGARRRRKLGPAQSPARARGLPGRFCHGRARRLPRVFKPARRRTRLYPAREDAR